MARYKKHIIVYDDTPQIIAEREMGDVSKWIDLVKFNNLHYPYFVDTPEEKLKDLNHLKTLGDTIIIPIEKTLADISTETLPKRDKAKLEEIVLGTDLSLDKYEKTIRAHGTEDEIVELTGNGKGDLKLVSGIDNIKQTLLMRLLTPKGALPLHPDYGSDIQSLIGHKNTLDIADKVSTTIQEVLEADPRIRTARLVTYDVGEIYYQSSWEIELQSFDTYFTVLIQRDNDNNFLIM